MFSVQLTETQMSNLKTFLDRVQLSGKEVSAFLEILQTLEQSVQRAQQEANKKMQ